MWFWFVVGAPGSDVAEQGEAGPRRVNSTDGTPPPGPALFVVYGDTSQNGLE